MNLVSKCAAATLGVALALGIVGAGSASASTTASVRTVALAAATYTVKPGDTLSKIGGGNWYKLYDLNRNVIGSNPNRLRVGMVLQLPDNANEAAGFSSSENTVVVMPGQSLSSIGSMLGYDWHGIYNLNRSTIGSDPGVVHPGMVLRLS